MTNSLPRFIGEVRNRAIDELGEAKSRMAGPETAERSQQKANEVRISDGAE